MTVEVRIPTVLRKYTNGEPRLEVQASNVLEVIENVDKSHPGFKSQVVGESGDLHRFINVYLNDEDVRYLESLSTNVSEGDVVSILPAVAGGYGGCSERSERTPHLEWPVWAQPCAQT